MTDWPKNKKNLENKQLEKLIMGDIKSNDGEGYLSGILGDISQKSVMTQIVLGAASGWATGYATMKVGKLAAIGIGGTIILFEIGVQQGYIHVDWAKLTKKVDQAESVVTGESPGWIKKAERFVDRKLDKAERNAKKWYSKLIGDDTGPKINELHVFLAGFFGGVALGIASG